MGFIKKTVRFIIRIKLMIKYKNVKIKSGSSVALNNKFGGNNIINKNVILYNSIIGYGTYIGNDSKIVNTHIGKYCSIASNVKIVIGKHPTYEYISTHPAFFSTRKQAGFTYVDKQKFEEMQYIDKEKKISILIGNDVWIGENVTLIEGIKIGDGAIIGANAVVTKDIEPYSINVGVPAKKIRNRFEKEEIDFLEKFQWWNKSEEWIKENANKFDNISNFKGGI